MPKDKLPVPSEEFKEAVVDGGGASRLCELCGRQYFTRERLYTGDDEDVKRYKEYKKLAEKEPDKYIEIDSVSSGVIGGKQVVIDCECNELSKHEAYIWNNRYIIANYLKARSKKELKEKEHQAEALEKVLVER